MDTIDNRTERAKGISSEQLHTFWSKVIKDERILGLVGLFQRFF